MPHPKAINDVEPVTDSQEAQVANKLIHKQAEVAMKGQYDLASQREFQAQEREKWAHQATELKAKGLLDEAKQANELMDKHDEALAEIIYLQREEARAKS